MEQLVNDVLAFIRIHPDWAVAVIGLTAFAESFAIASFVFPGFAILVAAGALVQAGVIDPVAAAAAGATGAFVGDMASYLIGRAAGRGLRHWRPLASRQGAIDRGETFFRRYGMASVFFGHFLGPLRAFVPLTAGMCRMPFAAFFAIAAVAAAVWAPALLFSGYVVGAVAASGWPLEQKALAISAGVAALLLLVWLSRKLFKSG